MLEKRIKYIDKCPQRCVVRFFMKMDLDSPSIVAFCASSTIVQLSIITSEKIGEMVVSVNRTIKPFLYTTCVIYFHFFLLIGTLKRSSLALYKFLLPLNRIELTVIYVISPISIRRNQRKNVSDI